MELVLHKLLCYKGITEKPVYSRVSKIKEDIVFSFHPRKMASGPSNSAELPKGTSGKIWLFAGPPGGRPNHLLFVSLTTLSWQNRYFLSYVFLHFFLLYRYFCSQFIHYLHTVLTLIQTHSVFRGMVVFCLRRAEPKDTNETILPLLWFW